MKAGGYMVFTYYPLHMNYNARYQLNNEITFSAAHFIPTESAGKCARIHGHNYVVNITIVGNQLNENGFLVDFKTIKQLIHDRFDHTLLNDHEEFKTEHSNSFMPSSERVAEVIWNIIQKYLSTLQNKPTCVQVLLRETPTSYVIFRPQVHHSEG